MRLRLTLDMLAQPDGSTCGPTCLHAVYRFFGDRVDLREVIAETQRLEGGGTLAVLLALHALGRGYGATIYTCNLQVFDPTWFPAEAAELAERLGRRRTARRHTKLALACGAYREFLDLGGRIRFEELTPELIFGLLERETPILTGLSATYLHGTARELDTGETDDVAGDPVGHFVVLCGGDAPSGRVLVADPLEPNPLASTRVYAVGVQRLLSAILLGIVTYDANLLVLEPPPGPEREGR